MALRSPILTAAVAAAGLLSLAACNSEGRPQGTALAPAAGPSNVLVFSDDGANAKLALAAQPAALMLECAHGSGAVHLTHASDRGPAPVITLASDGAAQPLKAERQAFEGQTLVLADLPADAPPLQAFRRSGRIAVDYAGARLTADARPEAFFAACSKAG
jgi:hypothetical protein